MPIGVESLRLPSDYTRTLKAPFSKTVVRGLEAHYARFKQTMEELGEDASPADIRAEFDIFRDAMSRLTPTSTTPSIIEGIDRYAHDFMVRTSPFSRACTHTAYQHNHRTTSSYVRSIASGQIYQKPL